MNSADPTPSSARTAAATPPAVGGAVAAAVAAPGERSAAPVPTFAEIYATQAAFVWRSVRRLGVRPADVEDVCQEVFLVAHKKLSQFEGGSLRAWLFAIALRNAADYRKRAHVRREATGDSVPEIAIAETTSGELDRARARVVLDDILERLDEPKRAVFVLFELEQMPMTEVAAAVECPLQTAYSRLHAARDEVKSAIERLQARDRSAQPKERSGP